MTPFKAGETYRTRDGREARVYATDGAFPYTIHGAVKNPAKGWTNCVWANTGRWSDDVFERDGDLMPPTPPSPPAFDEASWRAGAEAMREKIIIGLNSRNTLVMSADSVARHTEIPPPPAPSPEPERKKLTAGGGNPIGRLVSHVATAQAERDAARADMAALQQVIDQQAAQLDASRAETEAVRRERDALASEVDCHEEEISDWEAAFSDEKKEVDALRSLAAELVEGWQQAAAVAERAKIVSAPEDAEVEALCNRTGYGAVMDAAARLWVKRDPIGAFVCGPCLGTVQSVLTRARAQGIGEKEKAGGE